MCVHVSHEVRPLGAIVGCEALKSSFHHCKSTFSRQNRLNMAMWAYQVKTNRYPAAYHPNNLHGVH